jgi:lysophospholipase L1-like esterase
MGSPAISLHTVSEESYESTLGMWEPGQDFLNLANPALPYRVRINSLGFRGADVSLESDKPRVLFIGDSFTFGDYVDDDDTLPAQVGSRLGLEVINAGVGGTTIVDQRHFLERALVLRPDVVVLVYFENDLNDLLEETPQYVRIARNRALKSGILAPAFVLVRDTALFHSFMEIRARWFASTAPKESTVPIDVGVTSPAWVDRTAAQYAAGIEEIRALLTARGIQLVVVAFPHPWSVGGDLRGLPDRILPVKKELAKRGIAILDLTPPLRESGRRLTELYLLPEDGHASPLGYQIAADELAPEIERALGRAAQARNGAERVP